MTKAPKATATSNPGDLGVGTGGASPGRLRRGGLAREGERGEAGDAGMGLGAGGASTSSVFGSSSRSRCSPPLGKPNLLGGGQVGREAGVAPA